LQTPPKAIPPVPYPAVDLNFIFQYWKLTPRYPPGYVISSQTLIEYGFVGFFQWLVFVVGTVVFEYFSLASLFPCLREKVIVLGFLSL